MKFRKIFNLFVLFIFTLTSCKENIWDVKLNEPVVDFEVVNVDSAFLKTDTSRIYNVHMQFVAEIGAPYKAEVSNNTYHPFDSTSAFLLKQFYENEFINAIEKEKLHLESERDEQLQQFKKALAYFKHHFPHSNTPDQVVLMNNMFSGVLLTENQIFVGLERYLPGNLEVIRSVPSDQLHQWQKDDMDISFLARDMILPWIQVHLFQDKDEHLAYHIVQAGKVLMVLQACFPHRSEAFILRYSEEEWGWAVENEAPFWNYLVKEQLLFQNNMRDKANFLNEAPYTVGLPEKGPDRFGQYLGFQMVKSFLKQNKGLSLQELLETNFNDILQAYEI